MVGGKLCSNEFLFDLARPAAVLGAVLAFACGDSLESVFPLSWSDPSKKVLGRLVSRLVGLIFWLITTIIKLVAVNRIYISRRVPCPPVEIENGEKGGQRAEAFGLQ